MTTDYIEIYKNKYNELKNMLDSSMPNLNEQNKILAQINKIEQWILNDESISEEIKEKITREV